MIFRPLELDGAMVLEPERHGDERGFFARAFCEEEFAVQGLETRFPQHSFSFNHLRGTVRGLHFQAPPHEEAKVVRCVRGRVFDVLVDLRPDSPTRGRSIAVELDAEAGNAVYIPTGFAHGFQTLSDGAELLYLISRPYAPESARGHRYDDPAFAIDWPLPVTVISERDLALPAYEEAR